MCGAVTEQRLPPVLRVETEREKELIQQLNKMKREFDDFKERSTPVCEEEMKRRDSRFCFFCFFYHATLCERGICCGSCLSVCLSQVGLLLKPLKCWITQTTPHDRRLSTNNSLYLENGTR